MIEEAVKPRTVKSQEELDKEAHFNILLGHMNTNEEFILNSVAVKSNSPFNLYVKRGEFNELRENLGLSDDSLKLTDFLDWLHLQDLITPLEAVDSKPIDITTIPLFNLYPYFPSYKDILWVARILRPNMLIFKPDDIYHLALYRGFEINGVDVDKVITSRKTDDIFALLRNISVDCNKRREDYVASLN